MLVESESKGDTAYKEAKVIAEKLNADLDRQKE